MTSAPEAASASPAKDDADKPAAPSDSARPFLVLQKRRDFLAAARARRWATPGMVVQGRNRAEDEAPGLTRIGYTCSKKVGNAVARNRAKRRLRAAAAAVLPRLGRPGWDYVLIGRSEATAPRPFSALIADLESALDHLHTGRGKGAR